MKRSEEEKCVGDNYPEKWVAPHSEHLILPSPAEPLHAHGRAGRIIRPDFGLNF